MKGVIDLFNLNPDEEVTNGLATIKAFEIDKSMSKAMTVRSSLNRDDYGLSRIDEGKYIKLIVDGELMMSDTTMERNTNLEFVARAHGDVMIAGLGIGLIINALRSKVESGKVTSITVYEKYQDVIDLVYPKYSDMPLKVICQDIITYKPPKDETYDTIYFDIWPEINTDNLDDIRLLHNRWKNRKRLGAYMNSWMKEFLQDRKRENRKEERLWHSWQ